MNQSDESFSRHRHAWELIPWVVNNRASAEERRAVEEHTADCADCREELALQTRLYAAMRREAPATAPADPQPALRRLWQRIDAAAPVLPRRRVASLPLARGLLAAVLIEAIGIAALSAALWSREAVRDHAPLYQTLSAPAEGAPRASIRAVLAPTLSLGELEALLGRTHLQIVGGPGDGGVYSLAPLSPRAGSGVEAEALAQLRSHPGVRFAEPVNTAPQAMP
jgi:anti-sigma factor RsiW